MSALNANIKAFNSYEESPKLYNSYFRGNFELARKSTSQTQEGWQKEDRAPQCTELANESIWSTEFSVLHADPYKQPGGHPMDRSGACSGLMNDTFFFPPAAGQSTKPTMDGLWRN